MHNLAFFLLQSVPDEKQIQGLVLAFMAFIPLIILIAMVIVLVPMWFICKKAGFSPWLSLISLVPSFGLLILLYVLAFAEWPSQRPTVPAAWNNPPLPPQPPLPPYSQGGN